jgi:hypothetical protein
MTTVQTWRFLACFVYSLFDPEDRASTSTESVGKLLPYSTSAKSSRVVNPFIRTLDGFSAGTLAILTGALRLLPESFQKIVGIIPEVGHDRFLTHPFQFIIHLSSYNSTLYFSYWQRRNISYKIEEVLGRTNRLLPLIRHGPHWKRRVQQLFYSCVCICYSGKVRTEPLPSNDKGDTQTHTQTATWSHKPTLFFKIRKVAYISIPLRTMLAAHACRLLARLISVLKKEAVRSSEILVNFYQTIQCHIPKNNILYSHRPDNLKLLTNVHGCSDNRRDSK